MAKIRLDKQESELEESLKKLQDDESKFLDDITKKYGQATLNPETGVFTANTTENKSE